MAEVMGLIGSLVRFSFPSRRARLRLAAIVVGSALAGLASTGLVAVMNATLHQGARPWLLAQFVALCLVLPGARFLSNWLLLHQVQDVVYDLRRQLSRRILAAPLRQLEEVGAPRLLAMITDDVDALTDTLSLLPLLSLHLTVVAGCLTYLAYLSPRLLLLVLAFVVVGIVSYQLPAVRAQGHFGRLREEMDRLFEHFRGLTQGTKELKLHGPRRRAFLEERLEPTAAALRRHSLTGHTIYAVANTWGQMLFFVAIGLVLFGAPRFLAVDPRAASGYALAILFMATPLDVLLGLLPQLGRSIVAIRQIERLGLSLPAERPDAAAPGPAAAAWSSLELVGVTHSYRHERDEEIFTLGPLDFTVRPGELIFIVGGNGSGKTTFAKLLTGLYVAESGEIRLDGRAVGPEALEAYRQNFSVVFTDFFLFESLLGLRSPEVGERANRYLAKLQLERKVTIENGELSTLDLSQGQRKRLALLTAYLEDRPIYLFDEWAADQDPYFKEIFYLQLLAELKARGKTVFVISHDDRYFRVADRIVRLNFGRIEQDSPNL
jgi:putative ATP-binding cassette transporter